MVLTESFYRTEAGAFLINKMKKKFTMAQDKKLKHARLLSFLFMIFPLLSMFSKRSVDAEYSYLIPYLFIKIHNKKLNLPYVSIHKKSHKS